jgi:hypothetical protein
LEEQAAEAIKRALPAEFVAELEGHDDGDGKRQSLAQAAFGLQGYEAPDAIWYNRENYLKLLSRSIYREK